MEVGTARAIVKQIFLNVRPHRDCEGVEKKQHKQVKNFRFAFLVDVQLVENSWNATTV
jgi:hypothetical protein